MNTDDLFTAFVAAILFGDSNRDETIFVAQRTFPDCWEFTPVNDEEILVKHNHNPATTCGVGEGISRTMHWQALACEMTRTTNQDELTEKQTEYRQSKQQHNRVRHLSA